MSSPDQIVIRLQQQKNQIARMLTPGSKRLSGDQSSWGFSPVAPDFGGRKFELAAQKMRILNRENMGEARSARTMNMANTIQAKFQDAHNMLHISTVGGKANSFWSEVEKIFPNQSSGRAETPIESDGLRRGSLIQQFSTFPKPGQSLESFKEQTPRNPVMRKVDTSLPKRANLSPKDRLFSRVQELTAGQKEKKNIEQTDVEKPVASSSPALSENVQRQVEQVSTPRPNENAPQQVVVQDLSPSADENIQRRVEQVSPPVPKQTVQRKMEKPATLTPRDATVKSPPLVPDKSIQRKVEQPVPPARREASVKSSQPDSNETVQRKVEQTLPSVSRGFIPEVNIQKSSNVSKSELPARPAQKVTADTPRLPIALPLKKSDNLDIPATVKPAMPVAQLKIDPTPVVQPAEQLTSTGQVVQRQPETPEPQRKQEAPPSEFVLDTAPESAAKVANQQAVPVASQQAEMPLRKHLERKQSAFGGLSLEVGHIRPVAAARNILQLKNNPIQRRLSVQKKEIAFDALPPVKSPSTLRTRSEALRTQPESLRAQPESFSLHTPVFSPAAQGVASAPVSMALAKMTTSPASIQRAAFQMTASPAPIQRAALQMPVAQLTPAKPIENSMVAQALVPQSATQNVIQRALVEHDEPQHIEYPPTQEAASSGSVNITDLAEKIFPLVKQLILIEFERTGSRFR